MEDLAKNRFLLNQAAALLRSHTGVTASAKDEKGRWLSTQRTTLLHSLQAAQPSTHVTVDVLIHTHLPFPFPLFLIVEASSSTMAQAHRRVAPPSVYSQVPTSPPNHGAVGGPVYSSGSYHRNARQPSYPQPQAGPEETAQGVQVGTIGGGYGPYSVSFLWSKSEYADMFSQ